MERTSVVWTPSTPVFTASTRRDLAGEETKGLSRWKAQNRIVEGKTETGEGNQKKEVLDTESRTESEGEIDGRQRETQRGREEKDRTEERD